MRSRRPVIPNIKRDQKLAIGLVQAKFGYENELDEVQRLIAHLKTELASQIAREASLKTRLIDLSKFIQIFKH